MLMLVLDLSVIVNDAGTDAAATMTASAGGIDITAAGAADKDLDLTCT